MRKINNYSTLTIFARLGRFLAVAPLWRIGALAEDELPRGALLPRPVLALPVHQGVELGLAFQPPEKGNQWADLLTICTATKRYHLLVFL